MSRLKPCLDNLHEQGRTALVPFVTAGDPNSDVTVPLMHAMVKAGASIIELGVPFSDPMADGPVIQHANERALVHHVSLRQVMEMVREFRTSDNTTPVVLMGYLNPIEVMGYDTFAKAASEAGVDGAITVDLPPEEGTDLIKAMQSCELDPIFLLSPTTSDARISTICSAASGFVYYVSLKGVTGAANLDVVSVADNVARIRSKTDLPVGVGFGIKDAESAARVATVADAVVVGSAIVKIIEQLQQQPEKINKAIGTLLSDMREAMDNSSSDLRARGKMGSNG